MNSTPLNPCRFVAAVAVFTALAGAASSGFAQTAKPTIVEKIVGPAYTPGTVYTLSEKGMRLATTQAKGSKFVVTVDGVDGEEFDQILPTVPTFDTQYDSAGIIMSQSVARRGPVALSRDGQRYAYAGRRGSDPSRDIDALIEQTTAALLGVPRKPTHVIAE